MKEMTNTSLNEPGLIPDEGLQARIPPPETVMRKVVKCIITYTLIVLTFARIIVFGYSPSKNIKAMAGMTLELRCHTVVYFSNR